MVRAVRKASTRQQKEILAACRGAARKLMERSDMRGVRFHRSVEELRRDGMSPLVIAEMERIHGVRVQEMRENAAGSRRRRAVGASVARSAFARGVQQELLREAGLTDTPTYPTQTLTEAVASGALDPGKQDFDFSYRSPGTTMPRRSREPVPAGHERDGASDLHDDPGSFTKGMTMKRTAKGRGGHPAATRPSSPPGDWESPMRKYSDSKRWGASGGDLDETEDGVDPEGRKSRLRGGEDESEMYADEDERMTGSEDEDETREMHDPEGELGALNAVKDALDQAVEVFSGDEADDEIRGKLETMASDVGELISGMGDHGSEDEGEDEDEDGNPLTRPDGEDELEDEMRARGMHMAEPEDEDEMEPGSIGPHDGLFSDDLSVPRMMPKRERGRIRASVREAFRGSGGLTATILEDLELWERAGRSA